MIYDIIFKGNRKKDNNDENILEKLGKGDKWYYYNLN